jgi:hypothetical protein
MDNRPPQVSINLLEGSAYYILIALSRMLKASGRFLPWRRAPESIVPAGIEGTRMSLKKSDIPDEIFSDLH